MKLTQLTPLRRRQDGSAVIVVFAILALILIFSTANQRTLHLLSEELRLLDRQQIQNLERFYSTAPLTNAPTELEVNEGVEIGSD